MSWSGARSATVLAFALALGCGPSRALDDGGTDSGNSEDGGTSSGGSSSGGSSGGGSSGGGSSSGGTGSSGGGTQTGATSETSDPWPTTDETSGTDCPPSEGAMATWALHDWPSDPGLLVCIVEEAYVDPNGRFQILLDCGGLDATSMTLVTSPFIDIMLEPGWTVEIDYIEDQPWWIDYYFTMRAGPNTGIYAPGDLILAGVNATRPTPWGDDGFFRPFILEPYPQGCIPVPDPDSGCGDEERVALGDSTYEWVVLDGASDIVGEELAFRVNVERAVEYRDVVCDDFPESWYTALIAAQP